MYDIITFFINLTGIWLFMTIIGCLISFFIKKKLIVNDILFNTILGFGAPIYQILILLLGEEKTNKINNIGEIIILNLETINNKG